MKKIKVLSTKKLKPLLIDEVKEKGIEITEHEFINIVPIDFKPSHKLMSESRDATVIFTSRNAVVNINGIEIQNVYCLSGSTKTAVEEKFPSATIVGTADNAKDLSEEIIEAGLKEVLFFCGHNRRDELPSILKKAGVTVQEVVVYETIETPVAVSNDFDAVLFFSPSAVSSFFQKNQLQDDKVCFAIGGTTADAIKNFAANEIRVSKATTQESILSDLEEFFKKERRMNSAE
jgi:uroporphyrinogen-III synthase